MFKRLASTALAVALVATVAPTQAADFSRVVATNGDWISIHGEIMDGDTARLAQWAGSQPSTVRIAGFTLNSKGGSLLEAVRLSGVVREMGLPTYVSENRTCASACFLIWASGKRRMIAPGGALGVHSASISGQETAASMAGSVVMIRQLKAVGVPDSILGRIATTPPDSIVWLHPEDLSAMNVETVATAPSQPVVATAPAQSHPNPGFLPGYLPEVRKHEGSGPTRPLALALLMGTTGWPPRPLRPPFVRASPSMLMIGTNGKAATKGWWSA
jgi:hypothetical protein